MFIGKIKYMFCRIPQITCVYQNCRFKQRLVHVIRVSCSKTDNALITISMSKCPIVMFIYVFRCPECSCIYLYCSPVI